MFHQDDKKSIFELDRPAQLNCVVDAVAKWQIHGAEVSISQGVAIPTRAYLLFSWAGKDDLGYWSVALVLGTQDTCSGGFGLLQGLSGRVI